MQISLLNIDWEHLYTEISLTCVTFSVLPFFTLVTLYGFLSWSYLIFTGNTVYYVVVRHCENETPDSKLSILIPSLASTIFSIQIQLGYANLFLFKYVLIVYQIKEQMFWYHRRSKNKRFINYVIINFKGIFNFN